MLSPVEGTEGQTAVALTSGAAAGASAQDRFRRARVEYFIRDGRLEGTVTVAGEASHEFQGVAELEALLGAGRGRLLLVDALGDEPGNEAVGLSALTAAERAVAEAAAAGASNREIAAALFYSVKSVEAYLTRIYRRLGLEGRAGLAEALAARTSSLDDLEPRPEDLQQVAGGNASAASATPTMPRAQVDFLLV
jgi:DNA-binding CsgD family transcriptional regulator